MRGQEFIDRVKKLARERYIECRVDKKRGKGSHVTLYYGMNSTIIPDLKRELKTGTLRTIANQLGIRLEDLNL